ncbi:MAG: hypothetical protein EOP35_05130 [Rubrivivax sp.]|nr:MAG: hypothetical protein EOP35_05130 [Rubrivivax sp.]
MSKPITAKTAAALAAIVTDDLQQALARVDTKHHDYATREMLRGMAFETALVQLVGALAGVEAEQVIAAAIDGPTPTHSGTSGHFLRLRAEDSQLNGYVTAGRMQRLASAASSQAPVCAKCHGHGTVRRLYSMERDPCPACTDASTRPSSDASATSSPAVAG